MIGIEYKNKLWVVFELKICECGNHVHKHLLRGNKDFETIMAYAKKILLQRYSRRLKK
jgi:hypothetical protein